MEMHVPTPGAGVTLQRVGGEAILYDRQNGRAHVINSSAARIWELCDGRATVEEITGAFAAAYALPASDVRADVASILTTFRELRVLD
jgi:pyrroloquinoline quinone biosynthesis protein D